MLATQHKRGNEVTGKGMALALAAALALLGPLGASAQTAFRSTVPTQRIDYWQQRQADIEAQLANPADLSPVRVLFLGDSITDFWMLGNNPWMPGKRCGRAIWDESFGDAALANHAINLGISGDRLEHVLFRLRPRAEGGLGQLDRADLVPEFVVLMIGINNSWDAEAPAADSIFAGIREVVRSVHARKPEAIIVLQSLLPTQETVRDRDIVRPVNTRIAAMAAAPEFAPFVRYLDLYPAFVDAAGVQSADLFNDGLHPSEAGYRVWRDRLVPFLEQLRLQSPNA